MKSRITHRASRLAPLVLTLALGGVAESPADSCTGMPVNAAINCEKQSYGKVSAKLRALLLMVATARGDGSFTAAAASNALARVDDDGRVQTYVYFSHGRGDISTLAEHGAHVEVFHRELNMAQVWLAAERIDDVAALESVARGAHRAARLST